jgi:predicted NBD/HSP70 family sugar kinase
MLITPSHSRLLDLLRREAALSRWELHQRTGLRPNTVGDLAGDLLNWGLACELPPQTTGLGRPRIPLEIDPLRRHVVGLTLRRGQVEICRLNLQGHLLGRMTRRHIKNTRRSISTAAQLLRRAVNDQTVMIGVSIPGFADSQKGLILLSAAMPDLPAVSVGPLLDAAGDHPLILDNDMHALGARWMLSHHVEAEGDSLLIKLEDGSVGGAMLIEGRPNRGCIIGGNEIGHTRLPVETERCFCGHAGCLERICSSDFLKRQDGRSDSLNERITVDHPQNDPALMTMTDLTAMGLANAVNFVRPGRVVILSSWVRHPQFIEALLGRIRRRLLTNLAERVRFDLWDHPPVYSAETAGWLALAGIYCEGWQPVTAGE